MAAVCGRGRFKAWPSKGQAMNERVIKVAHIVAGGVLLVVSIIAFTR